jgi:dTDP-4-amino-4,6-dideoxygalactose transaminase
MSEQMIVPFQDQSLSHRKLRPDIMASITRVVERADIEPFEEIDFLERQVAALCGTRYAVCVNYGVDSLILALKALGIVQGDEVITSANGLISTMMAITRVGATPVLVDIDDTLNIDPNQIEAAITPKTKAIMPVHYGGRMARIDLITTIAARYHLPVIEDASQAMGAEYNRRRAGSFGQMGCFSFFPSKDVAGSGDGGIVTTSDEALYKRLLYFRDTVGVARGATPLDSIQAAILMVKMNCVAEWNTQQRRIATFYNRKLLKYYQVPLFELHEEPVFHLYIIRCREMSHRRLQTALLEDGIDTRIHHPLPVHLQQAYAALGYRPGSFPKTEAFSKEFLSLPIYPCMPQKHYKFVADRLVHHMKT